ncbi:MAG: DUF3597 domain-containing protein [Anaerolineales bacterium]
MSIFKTIMSKLGLGKKEEPPQAAAPARPAAKAPEYKPMTPMMKAPAQPAVPARPAAISEVDVVSKLEEMAKANPEQLDWKVSIVDLLKLLGIDSSLEARKELATELGCPDDLMADSAKMNVWLHKTVLRKIAENGGNIPKELLD